jgi:hypothetical protein
MNGSNVDVAAVQTSEMGLGSTLLNYLKSLTYLLGG